MASNLKNRLQRIRNMARQETPEPGRSPGISGETFDSPPGFGDEWAPAGFKVLKRSVYSKIIFSLPPELPEELKVLVPDFSKTQPRVITPEELVFFDLETTGLSGGAGTTAFLAAFGFFQKRENKKGYSLRTDQYLLLDYPGEADFLESIVPILGEENKIIVTYNGKTFDTKLLRTRCLMNGIRPPEYPEADLLHPARRLWKKVLPNCSQAEIEVSVLGLDRTGDVSGAFAPQIWFDFLNSGSPGDLLKICGHNQKDIEGLASMFGLMLNIASRPLEILPDYTFDIEAVALKWRDHAKWFPNDSMIRERAETLMAFSVREKCPRAMYARGYDLLKKGRHDEGLPLLDELAQMDIAVSLKTAVLGCLAMDAEWRLRDAIRALNYTDALLQTEGLSESFREKAAVRRERLLKKIVF